MAGISRTTPAAFLTAVSDKLAAPQRKTVRFEAAPRAMLRSEAGAAVPPTDGSSPALAVVPFRRAGVRAAAGRVVAAPTVKVALLTADERFGDIAKISRLRGPRAAPRRPAVVSAQARPPDLGERPDDARVQYRTVDRPQTTTAGVVSPRRVIAERRHQGPRAVVRLPRAGLGL